MSAGLQCVQTFLGAYAILMVSGKEAASDGTIAFDNGVDALAGGGLTHLAVSTFQTSIVTTVTELKTDTTIPQGISATLLVIYGDLTMSYSNSSHVRGRVLSLWLDKSGPDAEDSPLTAESDKVSMSGSAFDERGDMKVLPTSGKGRAQRPMSIS